MNQTLLIRNALAILTGGRGAAARVAGPDIRVRDGRIDAIGALAPLPGEPTLDATDCVVYPAWVNTHHHLFQSLLKGDPAGIDATLGPWLSATPLRHRAAFDAELFRLAARIGLVELALSGCATVADHQYLYWPGMPFDPAAILFEEAEALGLRFVLCRGGGTRTRLPEGRPLSSLPAAMQPETLQAFLDDIDRLARLHHDPSPAAMRRIAVAPTAPPWSMAPEELRQCADFARARGLRLHSHLSETVAYQDTVLAQHDTSSVRFCESVGWLGADVWFAHLVKLDADEIALLGATGTGIAHCPQSNGRLGSGISPVRELEAAGVPVSIGVDGAASNEAADMVSETHAAWLMHRADPRSGPREDARSPGHRTVQPGGHANAMTVEDVVHIGTAGGARVLGLSGVGTLQVGMAADIAVYDLDQPRHFGLHDSAVGPVASGGRPTLRALLVQGRVVVENDAIPGLDMAQLRADAQAFVKTMLA